MPCTYPQTPPNIHTGPVTKTRASFERELLEWDLLKAWEEETTPAAKPPAAPKEDGEVADEGEVEEEGEITADGGGKEQPPPPPKVEEAERWTPVPDTFTSAAQYVDVWFPLLLQEMRAETLSEVTTEGLGGFCKVSWRFRLGLTV